MGIAAKRILEREDNSMKTALAAAQQSSFLDTAAFPIIIVVIAIIAILAILASGYVKAPPDQAYIISGLKKESKILIGRAGIKIPFLERMDKLYLGQMTVDIKTEQSVPTNDFINVNVDAVAKVRINPTTDGIKLAAKNFLNKKPGDIALDLQDSLQGNMREIIGTLSLKVINTDRDSFSDQVMMKASKDMDKLGIEILSCNIQNVTDENGLIKDLGADNTSLIKKNAAIAKAQADRDIAIAQAEADKAANEARVLSDTQIAQKNNELEIRRAELKIISDNKKAEADAAYKIQAQSQQQDAEAKKAMAEAVRFAREQEAEGIRATGLAEAEAIRAKATAEAEGIDKKAEAMKKYGEAAIIEMIMQALPEIAKNVAEPLSKVDKITMYGEGNSAKMLQDIINSTTQVTEGLAQGMGIDVKALLSSIVGAKIASNTPEDPQKSDSDEYEQ